MIEKPDSFSIGAFEVSRNPDVKQFVEKLNRLREAVDECRLQPGSGYTVNRSTSGTTLYIDSGTNVKSEEKLYPFYVYTKRKDSKLQIRIIKESEVADTNGKSPSISGLDEWKDVDVDGRIYLEVKTTDNGDIESAKIVVSKSDLNLYEDNISRILIASIDSKGKIVQNVKTHLRSVNASLNGVPAVVLLTYAQQT